MPPSEIDVVIPIPESSRPSAMQLALRIGKPYREGFVKNRYIGRTFIMPGQAVRRKSVRQKLNAIDMELPGELAAAMEKANADPKVHGILVQLPLPKQLDETAVLDGVAPATMALPASFALDSEADVFYLGYPLANNTPSTAGIAVRIAARELGFMDIGHDPQPIKLFDGKILYPDRPIEYLNSLEIKHQIRIEEIALDPVVTV